MYKFESEKYKVNELRLLDGTTKDVAVLEKVFTGEVFQDNYFAFKTSFKINLGKSKDTVK